MGVGSHRAKDRITSYSSSDGNSNSNSKSNDGNGKSGSLNNVDQTRNDRRRRKEEEEGRRWKSRATTPRRYPPLSHSDLEARVSLLPSR